MTLKKATDAAECSCEDCMETTRSGSHCKSCSEAGCEPGESCKSESAWSPSPFAAMPKKAATMTTKTAGEYDVDLRALGAKMMNWHSSMNDPIYAVGSFFFEGRRHPQAGTEEKALAEFKKLLRIAETPAGAAHGGWSEDDVQELRDICDELQEVVDSGPEETGDDDDHLASVRAANVAKLTRHAAAAKLIRMAKQLMKAGPRGPSDQSFLDAYIETALWSTNDESTPNGGEPMDKNYGPDDITPETKAKMAADCKKFQSENADALAACGLSDDIAGHCFWLSRNGHGAGFFDRDPKDEEAQDAMDALQSAAEKFHEVNLYVDTTTGTICSD